ncbi:stage II sporulation protein M [Cerasibacillus quisquiliarum]|uniref:Stage II sporulation protein M n=1 Tax=Cerasibacillus quisquiliarum TaxID=227865 RepID=A0A511V1S0_9BACI|nr:stage II sporulation protein M [Cerasibacillus quisquiliarum]MBB5145434.1 stage II sporulation protein M [Cerasibacillus quisquiliarum]GEN31868.1 stage II sporulation protein M [Cerasibacillus quisquiliarum]
MYTQKAIWTHFKEHATTYVFTIILFLTGIIFGAFIVNSMHFVQKQDLFFYLEKFFGQLATEDFLNRIDILKSSFAYHVKYLIFIFILGLSIIGLPLVWILLFLKGLVVGFTVGFLVNQLGMKGFLIASIAVAPQNLLIIPIYLIAGSLSMIFSLTLFNKLISRKFSQPIFRPFAQYLVVFLFLIVISFLAATIEAFITNEAMQSLIKTYYTSK